MIRAFLAIQLTESLRSALATLQSDVKARLSHDLPRDVSMSWVRPGSLHLTAKFLGDIADTLVLPLREAMAETLRAQRVIDIPLYRLGAFPSLTHPRVLWVGPDDLWEQSDDATRLAALHRSIEACCASMSLAPDTRPLSPHLTLARIKARQRAVGQALAKSGMTDRPLALGCLEVDAITLMRSELKSTGSIYTVLWESKLKGA